MTRSTDVSGGLGREGIQYLIDTAKPDEKPIKCGLFTTFAFDYSSLLILPEDDSEHIYSCDFSLSNRKVLTKGTSWFVSHKTNSIAVMRGGGVWFVDLATVEENFLAEGQAIGFVEGQNRVLIHPQGPINHLFIVDANTGKRRQLACVRWPSRVSNRTTKSIWPCVRWRATRVPGACASSMWLRIRM